MNVGIVARPNLKGQIVIPKQFRDKLGIDENVLLTITLKAGGLFVTPMERGVGTPDSRQLSLTILKKTAGTWMADDWDTTERNRRKIELSASKFRKKAW